MPGARVGERNAETMTNHAVLMNTIEGTYELGDLPLGELAPNEVLVRSKAVGLCRSDIELLHGHLNEQLPVLQPIVPGHEWSGVVEAVGSEVTRLSPGDRGDGECVMADNHWFGFSAHGAASELFTVEERLVHVFPESFGFQAAALIEPYTISYNAIREIGDIAAGEGVAVIGAGMVGLASAAIAAAKGATVISIDPVAQRREVAARLGAQHQAASADEAQALLAELGSGGADLVIEASGHPLGIAATFELARFAGRIVNIGICGERSVSAPLHLIQAKNLRIQGVTGSTGIWPEAIDFMISNNIDLTPVITASYPLEQIAEAMEATEQGNIKVQLVLGEEETA